MIFVCLFLEIDVCIHFCVAWKREDESLRDLTEVVVLTVLNPVLRLMGHNGSFRPCSMVKRDGQGQKETLSDNALVSSLKSPTVFFFFSFFIFCKCFRTFVDMETWWSSFGRISRGVGRQGEGQKNDVSLHYPDP